MARLGPRRGAVCSCGMERGARLLRARSVHVLSVTHNISLLFWDCDQDSGVATGEGGKRANFPPPPNLRSDTYPREIDADPRRFSCRQK